MLPLLLAFDLSSDVIRVNATPWRRPVRGARVGYSSAFRSTSGSGAAGVGQSKSGSGSGFEPGAGLRHSVSVPMGSSSSAIVRKATKDDGVRQARQPCHPSLSTLGGDGHRS